MTFATTWQECSRRHVSPIRVGAAGRGDNSPAYNTERGNKNDGSTDKEKGTKDLTELRLLLPGDLLHKVKVSRKQTSSTPTRRVIHSADLRRVVFTFFYACMLRRLHVLQESCSWSDL